jgi:hypothetical protein
MPRGASSRSSGLDRRGRAAAAAVRARRGRRTGRCRRRQRTPRYPARVVPGVDERAARSALGSRTWAQRRRRPRARAHRRSRRVPPGDRGARRRARGRTGRHGQDLPRGRGRGARDSRRRSAPHRPRAAGRRGRGRSSVSFPATSRRRSIRTFVRSTTRCTTCSIPRRGCAISTATSSRSARSRTCAGARSTTRS